MQDIHSHILYNIDDGSESLMESLRLVKEAYDNGFTDIILTPHFRPLQGYKCDNQTKESIFNTLKEEVKKNKIDINLYF